MKRGRRPTAWDHNALGTHLYRIGAYDLAVSELRKATRLFPVYPTFQYNLACAYHACQRDEEAIAALRRALSLDAAHVEAHMLLGQLLTARGEHSAARLEFETILALQSEGPEADRARAGLRRLRFL